MSLRHVPVLVLASLLLAAGAQAQTLERVRESGTFKIGYREDAAPFAYKNELGEAVGYSVELCRAVAVNVKQALGLAEIKLEYIPVTTENRFQAIREGRIELDLMLDGFNDKTEDQKGNSLPFKALLKQFQDSGLIDPNR